MKILLHSEVPSQFSQAEKWTDDVASDAEVYDVCDELLFNYFALNTSFGSGE